MSTCIPSRYVGLVRVFSGKMTQAFYRATQLAQALGAGLVVSQLFLGVGMVYGVRNLKRGLARWFRASADSPFCHKQVKDHDHSIIMLSAYCDLAGQEFITDLEVAMKNSTYLETGGIWNFPIPGDPAMAEPATQ